VIFGKSGSKRSTRPRPSNGLSSGLVESLERRVFLHNPVVTGVTADNRGEILVQFDSASTEIDPAGFNKNSVQVYTDGPDNIMANADDTRVPASVRFVQSNARLVVRAQVAPDEGYRVKVVSSRVPVAPGFRIDGEFTGTFPSGNGTEGGNFEFQSKNDRGTRPRTRWSTSEGVINVTLFRDTTPRHFSNIRQYMDDGDYDNSFFTRSVDDFIVQGGSLQINAQNQIVEGQVRPAVQNEFNVSNTRGTVAMAKQGGDPNSATNQFFFNLGDNSENLDNQNGGFTVFGEVRGASGLAVMDAIAAKPTRDLTGQIGPFAATDISTVPVQQPGDDTLNPSEDLIIIRRVAQLVRAVPL
jgi:cyclophilin family peptidyl-prolyl cis-trans isomerase